MKILTFIFVLLLLGGFGVIASPDNESEGELIPEKYVGVTCWDVDQECDNQVPRYMMTEDPSSKSKKDMTMGVILVGTLFVLG